MLIRYGGLIANYHRGFTSNSRLVIWLLGMPGLPKETQDKDYTSFLSSGYDVVTAEYYGSFRSDGEFTPENCFKGILDTYNFFSTGGLAIDSRTGEDIQISGYSEIVVVGSSFGARFASRIHQYLPKIQTVGLFAPYLYCTKDESIGELSVDQDYIHLEIAGLKNMYRGRGSPEWQQFLEDQRGQPYDEMIQDLSQKDVFIAHGDMDDCVHVGRSRKLYGQLQAANPGGNHQYLEIPKGGHGGITKQIGVVEMCKWLNGR